MAFKCNHCFKGKENTNALQIGLPNFLGIKTAVHKMILPMFDWYFHHTIASQRGEEQNRKTLILPISKCKSAKSQ